MNPRVVGFLSLLVTSIALPPLWSAPVTIGMAEEVNEYVRAESTEGEKRQIRKDAPLYFGDKVTTDFEAYLKIRLLDDTTFTLGPRTTVTLDEFVYDPDTSQGKMTASVARGVFRFVTGEIVKNQPENFKVKMPVGTIGVRGTQTLAEVKKSKELVILEEQKDENGNVIPTDGVTVSSVVNGQVVQSLVTEPGHGVTVEPGKAPSVSFQVPKRDQERLTNSIASPKDQARQNWMQGRLDRPAGGGQNPGAGDLDNRKSETSSKKDGNGGTGSP